jgi:hypothetical protein
MRPVWQAKFISRRRRHPPLAGRVKPRDQRFLFPGPRSIPLLIALLGPSVYLLSLLAAPPTQQQILTQVRDASPRDYLNMSYGSKALAALAARCLGQLARPPAWVACRRAGPRRAQQGKEKKEKSKKRKTRVWRKLRHGFYSVQRHFRSVTAAL